MDDERFPSIHLREHNGKREIWDPLRRRWLMYTPEEAVRQDLIVYLVEEQGVAPGLIAVEREIRYGKRRKRFDLVVYDRKGQAFIVAECKAPEVSLSQDTLYQVARYNAVLEAPHLLVTNGLEWLFFSKNDAGKFVRQPSGWWESE